MAAPAADPLAVRLLYSPHDPTPPQAAFLKLSDLGVSEALYGGAAGGGKSDALLMDALRYVDVPGYSALILRRTYADLALPGAIMDRSKAWLADTPARWNEASRRWTFPNSRATLTFGYLQHKDDRLRYASAEFQFIAFDELTQFRLSDYRFLFSRLRGPSEGPLSRVPLRMRGATNPGGIGHDWVKARFIEKKVDKEDPEDSEERARKRLFIRAKVSDNPHIDQETYIASLRELDPFTRQQLLDGDWDADEPGDWVYQRPHLRAARDLGLYYDRLLADGTIPPPAGLFAAGIDWGEDAAIVLGWPLERGGMYLAAEISLESIEASRAAVLFRELVDSIYRQASKPRPDGWEPDLTEAERLAGKRTPGGHPPAVRPGLEPLRLVGEHRYDAAGIASQRTYIKKVREYAPQAKSEKVGFGSPAPKSGTRETARSYKSASIGYIRRLLERTYAADDIPAYVAELSLDLEQPWDEARQQEEVARILSAGQLAISARCETTFEQMRKLQWDDRSAGTVRKGDDHSADAVIALLAPVSVRHR